MNRSSITSAQSEGSPSERKAAVGRRTFLKSAGITSAAAVGLFAAACTDHNGEPPAGVFDLGQGDLGALNYAYALEQLEAAFYTKIVASPAVMGRFSSQEQMVFNDLKLHEVAHRDFFKAAITAAVKGDMSKVLPTLEVNLPDDLFSTSAKVLTLAKTFEDLGVAAYNGAGKYIENVDYLLLAGKIVSVEARHAAIISNMIAPKTAAFASDMEVDPATGLDKALLPSQVLKIVTDGGFIKTAFTAKYLP